MLAQTSALPEPEHPPADRAGFLEAMSRVSMAVSILTTDGPSGRDGMVVTAMCPVSADTAHPTLLVCVNAASRPAPVIGANGAFCVNVLAETQHGLADAFAGRGGGRTPDWFARAGWMALRTGAPALDGALVNFDCRIAEINQVGTHLVIIGSVVALRTAPGGPLVYADRGYRRLLPQGEPS